MPASVDSTKSNPHLHFYPKLAPRVDSETPRTLPDGIDAHPSTRLGGFVYDIGGNQTAGIHPTALAVMRQGEILKKQVGAGRHALQYIASGSAALGLAVACGGHPWAGFAVAAIGLLVGFGVQAYVRHRALNRVGPNGATGEDFKHAFEAMVVENEGIVNDPALETSRKMYAFLTRSMWDDCKHDLLEPAKRAALGTLNLLGKGLSKAFGGRPQANQAAEEEQPNSPEPAVA